MAPIAHSNGQSTQRSPLLYLTYSAARMHLLQASATYLKLRRIIADLSVDSSDRQPAHGYDLVLLYQRNRVQDPFNCTQHAPRGTSLCAEYTRADLKRAFGSEMSLSRKDNRPSRTNVGFWVCALWLMRSEREEMGQQGAGEREFLQGMFRELEVPPSRPRDLRPWRTCGAAPLIAWRWS